LLTFISPVRLKYLYEGELESSTLTPRCRSSQLAIRYQSDSIDRCIFRLIRPHSRPI